RHLCWALLLQAILNQGKEELQALKATYGSALTREVAFGQLLKEFCKKEIVILLKTLLSHANYSEKVSQGRYDFLRTSDSFKMCMNTAHQNKKLGWSKKTF